MLIRVHLYHTFKQKARTSLQPQLTKDFKDSRGKTKSAFLLTVKVHFPYPARTAVLCRSSRNPTRPPQQFGVLNPNLNGKWFFAMDRQDSFLFFSPHKMRCKRMVCSAKKTLAAAPQLRCWRIDIEKCLQPVFSQENGCSFFSFSVHPFSKLLRYFPAFMAAAISAACALIFSLSYSSI